MGKQDQKRPEYLIGIIKIWVIRITIGSSIAFFANKIDNYMDKKFGPREYDKAVIQLWDNLKSFF